MSILFINIFQNKNPTELIVGKTRKKDNEQ